MNKEYWESVEKGICGGGHHEYAQKTCQCGERFCYGCCASQNVDQGGKHETDSMTCPECGRNWYNEKKNIRYAVYWNTGEGRGGIEEIDMRNIWTPENPDGWTYQGIGGIHDNYITDFATRSEAEECLRFPSDDQEK